MVSSIISITFIVLAIISVLPGIFKARKRHWVEALTRTIFTVISAVITVVLTSILATKISGALVSTIEKLLASSDANTILTEVASAEGTLSIILSIIITPLLFVLLFLIIKLVLNLAFARLLTKAILKIAGSIKGKDYVSSAYPKKNEDNAEENTEKKKKTKKPICPKAATFGAICGLLSFTVLLVPVAGTMETVSSIGTNFEEHGTIHDTAVALNDNVAAKIMLPIAAPIWDNFNHYNVNGLEINIADEAHLVGVIMEAIDEVSSSDADTIHHSAEAFRKLSALCPNSSLIPCLCADFLNAASAHWLEGEDFGGIEMPSLSQAETTDDILEMLIKCLDNSSTETMREDLATISNVMAIIAENATIDEAGVIDMSTLFEDDRVISKLSVELLSNKRLAPVMSSLVKKQVETSGSQLELPEQDSEEYKVMVDTLTEKYQENFTEEISEESLDSLADAVGETVEQETGIVLSESEKIAIASSFISEFNGCSEITSDMVSSFIEQYRKQ